MRYNDAESRWCTHYCALPKEGEGELRGSAKLRRIRGLVRDARCHSSCRMGAREKQRYSKHLSLEKGKNDLAFKKLEEEAAATAKMPKALRDERLRRERCKGMPLRQCIERAEAMELATPGPGDGGVPNIG